MREEILDLLILGEYTFAEVADLLEIGQETVKRIYREETQE